MSIDIEAIRRRRANLLDDPGWVVDIDCHIAGGGPIYGVAMPDLDDMDGGWLCLGEPRFIVEFVAHAPDDVTALLVEVDRLTAEQNALRKGIADAIGYVEQGWDFTAYSTLRDLSEGRDLDGARHLLVEVDRLTTGLTETRLAMKLANNEFFQAVGDRSLTPWRRFLDAMRCSRVLAGEGEADERKVWREWLTLRLAAHAARSTDIDNALQEAKP